MTQTDRWKHTSYRKVNRLSEIDDAERRTELTVRAVEDYARRLRDFKASLSSKGLRCQIGAGLGTVVVDGNGKLRDISLNAGRIASMSPNAVAEQIMAAIKAAEARVDEYRRRHLKELFVSSHIF